MNTFSLTFVALLSIPMLSAGCGSTSATRSGTGSTVHYVPIDDVLVYEGLDAQTSQVAAASLRPWGGVVSERCREMEPHFRVAAARYGVDVGLLAGIAYVESTFNPEARNRSGAAGLMQVMPRNAERLGCGDLSDPEDNIACGVEVLQRFMKRYDNHVVYGLSAYNAGYGVPNRALEAGELPRNFRYVEKVLASRSRYLRHGCGD